MAEATKEKVDWVAFTEIKHRKIGEGPERDLNAVGPTHELALVKGQKPISPGSPIDPDKFEPGEWDALIAAGAVMPKQEYEEYKAHERYIESEWAKYLAEQEKTNPGRV